MISRRRAYLELPRQSCQTRVLGIGSNQGPKVKGFAQLLAPKAPKAQPNNNLKWNSKLWWWKKLPTTVQAGVLH